MSEFIVSGVTSSADLIPDPRREPTISVVRAGQILGVKKDAAYAAVGRGVIPSLRVGRHIRVPTARLLELVGLTGAEQ